jgi:hypothetical protein
MNGRISAIRTLTYGDRGFGKMVSDFGLEQAVRCGGNNIVRNAKAGALKELWPNTGLELPNGFRELGVFCRRLPTRVLPKDAPRKAGRLSDFRR